MGVITNLPWFLLILAGILLAHYTPVGRILP